MTEAKQTKTDCELVTPTCTCIKSLFSLPPKGGTARSFLNGWLRRGPPLSQEDIVESKQLFLIVFYSVGRNDLEKRRLKPHTDMVKKFKYLFGSLFEEIARDRPAWGHAQTW